MLTVNILIPTINVVLILETDDDDDEVYPSNLVLHSSEYSSYEFGLFSRRNYSMLADVVLFVLKKNRLKIGHNI